MVGSTKRSINRPIVGSIDAFDRSKEESVYTNTVQDAFLFPKSVDWRFLYCTLARGVAWSVSFDVLPSYLTAVC